MQRIDPPKDVIYIIDVLTQHGYEAYAVGGCIRDSVMGRQPKDWDITTNAYPDAVKGLFERTLDTGLSHGTVTVMMGSRAYEVTTFRIDGRYEDGRHPEFVEFTMRLEDDLKRRDFTINSMAWSAESGIIDLFGGMDDIAARVVRAVGDPSERFREDALRMLRAVRFAARLGFEIEKCTFDAIRNSCSLIKKISAERIREESTGILTSDDPARFRLLAQTGLLRQILEQFGYSSDGLCSDNSAGSCNKHSPKGSGVDNSALPENLRFPDEPCIDGSADLRDVQPPDGLCLSAVRAVEADICLRWAMLFRCFAVSTGALEHAGINNAEAEASYGRFLATAKDILRKLKFSNKNMDSILRLLKYADRRIEPVSGEVAKAAAEIGEDIFADLLKLKRATAQMYDKITGSDSIECIDGIEKIYGDLLASGRCLKLKDLAVSGRDLMRIGYPEGSMVGDALSYLLDCVLKDPELNRKDTLEKLALDYLSATK